jgi:hypothetical protein
MQTFVCQCGNPWEDFAETFAIYLDIQSVLGTAICILVESRRFGVDAAGCIKGQPHDKLSMRRCETHEGPVDTAACFKQQACNILRNFF